jgi:nucleotide-binding universal stress UspA family protein
MKHFRNILYVSEPDVEQARAIERAVALAENNQAQLSLLHVEREPRLGALGKTHTRREAEALLRQRELERLDALTAPHRKRCRISPAVRFGIPFIEVVRAVLRDGHDLVIKPAAGKGTLHYRLFGSSDMQLLRQCPCPVWVMRPDDRPNYERILAAVDFDPWEWDDDAARLNRQILETAGSLAISDFAELHMLHAWTAPAEVLTRLWGDQSAEEQTIAYVESERQHHRAGLDRLASGLREWLGAEAYDYLAPRPHLRRGPAREVIPAAASELGVDLVVMGTVARTGIPGFVIGNTAESVLGDLECSVLALKPDDFVTPVTVDE